MAFNHALVQATAGLLAPINGKERYATVGCSHFGASINAATHQCVIPFAELRMKSPDGQINVSQLCKVDAVMAELVNDGWTWTVIPFHVEGE